MIHDLKPYPSYKDSGDPWLGAIPKHWDLRSLGSLTSSISERAQPDLPLLSVVREKGVILRSTMRGEENHNFIPDDLGNYKVARAGSLVINKMKAWQGSLGIAPVDGIVSPAYFVFDFPIGRQRFGEALLRSWVYVDFFARVSDGVRLGQWDLAIDGMKRIPVVVPPLSEQNAIVRLLSDVDHRIQRYICAKKKLIALLNEQKQAIIHRAVTWGLDLNVRLKPSGVEWLGDVPEHWRLRKLRECGAIMGGMTPSMEVAEYWEGDIPWVTPKDMKRSSISDSSIRITERALQRTALSRIDAGSVLLVVRGMILARRVPIAWTTKEVTINQDMKALKPRGDVNAQFLAYSLDSAQEAFKPLIDEAGHGTRRLPTDRWREHMVVIPPLEEQLAINKFLEQSIAKFNVVIDGAAREIELLYRYRARLIADVVIGKLDVREVAAQLPDEEPEQLESDALADAEEDDDGTDPDADPEEGSI